MVHESLSFKRLLHMLSSVNAKLPLVSVGFCRADLVESYYSNNSLSSIVKRRRAGLHTKRDLLIKCAHHQGFQSKAAYIISKQGRKLLTADEAMSFAENNLQSLDIKSIHAFESTRHDPNLTIKVRQTLGETYFEIKPFCSENVQHLKDKRLKHKIMLVATQLIKSIELCTGKKVCDIVWEAIIDEANKVKVLYIQFAKVSSECRANCTIVEDEIPIEHEEPSLSDMSVEPERKRTKGRMSSLGYHNFVEMLAKQFEKNEKDKETALRLKAIRTKYSTEPDSAKLEPRLQKVLSSVMPQISRTTTLKDKVSKGDLLMSVHSMLQHKTVDSPKKSQGIMKPISYNRRKNVMLTKMKQSPNSLKNSTACAINRFREERLRHLELPHYSIKHSLSPSSPSNRLITLLLDEEVDRLKKKGHGWTAFLPSTTTPGSPVSPISMPSWGLYSVR
mmetsp:Transcript_21861/g.39861  ORF Transcript_21861/g.39861 Transcript_21861/m.39861 type:complete len:447 (-) Transcript_21861:24-1364(-)